MPDNKMLTPNEAFDVLASQVHAPVFFEKLARVYGIQPQSQEEARELLLMAGQLRNAHDQQNVKQAGVRGNFLAEARRDLDQTLTQQGFQGLVNEAHAVKEAAEAAVQNPLIKEAALVFSSFLADSMQQQ